MVDRLRELQASSPDTEASAVVSVDGLSIASALPQGVEEDRVSAMSAAMLSLGERIATELGRGTLGSWDGPRVWRDLGEEVTGEEEGLAEVAGYDFFGVADGGEVDAGVPAE